MVMQRNKIKYTTRQIDFLRTGYMSMNVRDLTRAFNRKFQLDKTEVQIHSTLTNHCITSGRTGQFEKGHAAWNAGTKGQGLTGANSGSFKMGNVPANRKPLGSERIDSKDGFILIKIAERNPSTGFPTRYKHKHVHIWEQANGPVPDDKVVAFIDGDKTHCGIENLMLISRAELLELNRRGYKDAPAELKASMLALVKLQVRTWAKEKKQR